MQCPSLSFILLQVFLIYIAYTVYSLSQLFVAPSCEKGKPCLPSCLNAKQRLHLEIYSSVKKYPSGSEASLVYQTDDFNYLQATTLPINLRIPRRTQQNGTLFFHVFVVTSLASHEGSFSGLKTDPHTTHTTIDMTQYAIPEAEAFNLLGRNESSVKQNLHPVTHIKSKVTFTIMTDNARLPLHNVPLELLNHLKLVQGRMFLPIVNYNFLQTRRRDLMQITPSNNTVNVTVHYSPISLGKLRLILHIETAMRHLKDLGFSDKDVDDVKDIFADTNFYLLGGTFFIAAIHLLLDFLAFKHDVSFWRRKDNLEGLSKWTVVWRGFSQTVIFLYLLDEGSSFLILVPTGIGSIIELWKLKKVLKLRLSKNKNNDAEIKTREFDAQSMHYLSYLLYPLIFGGTIYSLLYQPHKSWYSWSINSLVNGVYAFGFLFMLPQLFVNYKLKSVAHLPWRSFMYKAFNTFIDDVFAFIITMPTAHRIACFRDDVVFLIYLYQRWLYPVDKSRVDVNTVAEETVNFGGSDKKRN